ncbi:MAG: MATE family efflux transporter [Acidimicrobiia bacterium]|nr:MATE family efflux transporter [Acidimicrobiia bacterium]
MMRRSEFDREISRIAIPALGTLVADPVVSLVDTAFVGRIGVPELGALAVATAAFGVAFFLFNFLSYGVTPYVANAHAAGDTQRASQLIIAGLFAAVALGVASSAILIAGVGPILDLMGATADVVVPASTYLEIRALALPALLIVLVGHGAFRGYQDTKTPLWVSIGISVVNLVLDPLLIYGLDWGIAGAAWATVIAQWVGAGAFLWLLLVRNREDLGIERVRPTRRDFGKLFGAGWALIVRTAALVLAFTMATAVAARLGTVVVAAHQVAFQLWIFLALVVDALAIAGQALIGKYLGSAYPARAKVVAERLLGLGIYVGFGLALLLAALRPLLPGIFTDDPEVITAVLSVYGFVVLMQPMNALVFVWDGVLIGAEAFRYLAGAMASVSAVTAVMLLGVLQFDWGLQGVWWAIVVLLAGRIVTLWAWHLRWRPEVLPDHDLVSREG